MQNQLIFCLLSTLLSISSVSSSGIITDCDSDVSDVYNSVKLFCGRQRKTFKNCNYYDDDDEDDCGEWRNAYSCYNKVLNNRQATEVEWLETGDCAGNRLNETIPSRFINLQSLSISNYGVEQLSSTDLTFQHLTKLDASHNQLTNISDSLFINVPALNEIDFSHNKITEIRATDFKGASELTTISLSFNQISKVAKETFWALKNLTSLDLSNNAIETLHNDLLTNNSNLQTLMLNDNPIHRLDIFQLVKNVSSLVMFISCTKLEEFDTSRFGNSLVIEPSDSSKPFRLNLSGHFENLKHFNISGNQLHNAIDTFKLLESSVETIDMSYNFIGQFDSLAFKKFTNLTHLDLSSTILPTSNFMPSLNSSKLKVLRIENNPIKRLDCNIFRLLMGQVLVRFSWDYITEIDTSCLKNSIEIDLDGDDEIFFRSIKSGFDLRCTKKQFQQLTYFNVSGNELHNTQQFIRLLGPSLQSLDVSNNFVGKLNEHTFERCINLKHLKLSSTNLSNFHFSTFYHQRRLNSLDISYNHLGSVNFEMFLRSFRDLFMLNLEGNDLTNIDSVTRTIFPRLSLLGISKNHFTCKYLVKFLVQWQDLLLLDHPSNQTHVDGIDCHHKEDQLAVTKKVYKSSTAAPIEPKVTVHYQTNLKSLLTTTSPIQNGSVRNQLTGIFQPRLFDCAAFTAGILSKSCNQIQDIDFSCIGNSLKIFYNKDNGITFRSSRKGLRRFVDFRCTKEALQQIKFVNISSNQIENAPKLIASLSFTVETLGLARNFIGRLNASTFERFTNLKYLNLSQTNLSNFGFNTFYHQSKLVVLDISYNHLKTVNFTLFFRNFKNLEVLHLEGNDLIEVDTITRFNFPKLAILGISRNLFRCDYLATFLWQWEHLELHHYQYPSNQTHIDGVDCTNELPAEVLGYENSTVAMYRSKSQGSDGLITTTTKNSEKSFKKNVNSHHKETKKQIEHSKLTVNHLSADVQALKYLFFGLCMFLCIYFVIKSKVIQRVQQKINCNAMERIVHYQQGMGDAHSQQHVELIENGNEKN